MNYTAISPTGYETAAFVFAGDAAEFAIRWQRLHTTYLVRVKEGGLLLPDEGESVLDFTKRLGASRLDAPA